MRWAWTAALGVVAVVAAGCSPPVAGTAPEPAGSEPARSEAASAPPPPWVGTWAAAVQSGGRAFDDQTVRQFVHTSIGGTSVRVRLTNEFGERPLVVRGVHLARRTRGSAVDTGTARPVTFGGAAGVTIPAGQAVASDEIAVAVPAATDLAVSLHLPSATGPSTHHASAGQHNYVAAGDQSGAAALTGARTAASWFFLAGVDVRNAESTGAVVAFGASITDGLGAKFGANRRWPDLLAGRLRAAGRTVGVLNSGISGNQLLSDVGGYGPSALNRFDRDVLSQPGVRWVILSDDPINDLGMSGADPADLIAALRDLIRRGHDRGLRVICSTLTPYEGAGYWTGEGEKGRAAVNAFVRGPGNGCDAVLDQDTATHDPRKPTRYLRKYDTGDHLHPNDRGMRAIADAVDLAWFS